MNTHPTRIVVLGGGFAGAYCVKQLEKSLRGVDVEITLVNEQNYFVFTPMLVEAATSALEARHVVVPLRGFLRTSRFVMARISSIDIAGKTVTTQPEFGSHVVLPFDHLVMSLGSVTSMPDVPGVHEFAFGLKTLADATVLRDRAIGMLEMANLAPDHAHRQSWLTFAIVGAGYTGVEAAGEFNAFLKEAIRNYPNVRETDIRVMLLQRSGRILDALDEAMSEKASKVLRRDGVDIRLNESVAEISETSFMLKSGEKVNSHTVIWSAGVAPPALLRDSGLPTNPRGYLQCDRDLRVQGHDNVWGVGDCASNPDGDGNPYPPTAQHALREGRQAATNLAAVLQGAPTKPLDYHNKGTMAPLGGRQAIANVFGMHLTGLIAWMLWRGVYLGIMPGWGRKIRVAMDWTTDLFFRRDYAQQHAAPRCESDP
ncbi:NAD(P)/FAD-dependent oxidoreductase [Allorhodopirellula heiligendammensis]|uniref:NADH:ubiquinone reductase (non-electrogenic) n=1 Tax=Allorhodopirellula heiligendammensis TaxID=2714739 RepID=A0A5C6C539_9BACT|nr:NAD(P)/FAD-dependent oxidoreductase [Allorhodopirellula heiligendammensis]TWU19683.1 NADH dehydrogenase-like protein [Allorhodopirellula heiligendammensis]